MMRYCLLALFTLTASLPVFADCETRHFYNNSPVAFHIEFRNATCSIGEHTGEQCDIPAGAIADLHYPNGMGVIVGSYITIESSDGGKIFKRKSYDVAGSCRISHGGSTGNIVVNDPADGDIATCGVSTYPCDTTTGAMALLSSKMLTILKPSVRENPVLAKTTRLFATDDEVKLVISRTRARI